jgi:pimeloyl-ACP methyl ester carboxylesterase
MKDGLINYKSSQISYRQFGSGPKVVLCFHGYGEEAVTFEFLGKFAAEQFAFYAIDLPFHGQTIWNDGTGFTTYDLQRIIEKILVQNNGQPVTSNQQLTLLGFSLGGRIALSLYQAMPEQIEKLLLLAPDGLKVNFWYWLATQTWLGKNLFAFTMKYPGWFFVLLKALNKLRFVNASIFKFVSYYIDDKEARMLLYNRWITLRKIKSGITQIKSFIKRYKTPVRLVYGKHDRIILSSVGEKFRKGIEEQCSITEIHSGHQVLHEKHVLEILPILLG